MDLNRVKGGIFDVDGTLLDTMGTWHDCGARYLMKRFGIEAEPDLGDKLFADTATSGAAYIIRTYHLDQTVEQVAQGIIDEMADFYRNEAQPKEGAVELLDELQSRGIPMCIVTSTDEFCIDAAFTRLGFHKYFTKIYSANDLGMLKSEPDIFWMAARDMGTEPADTWVFEDGLYAVETAKKAGFPTVGIYDETSEQDHQALKREADLFVYSLKDLLTDQPAAGDK